MGYKTGIAWTHHTFNPWWGCTKVSPGCEHCYAEKVAQRFNQAQWGKDHPRRLFSSKHWQQLRTWNARAKYLKKRELVFCASMADVADTHPSIATERQRLWQHIADLRGQNLIFQLLTKRPALLIKQLPNDWGKGYDNVWLGASIEDRAMAYRVHHVTAAPAAVHFLSLEPLLERIDPKIITDDIEWVIIGGESGACARPFDLDWAHEIISYCAEVGIPVFVKQLGSVLAKQMRLRSSKGGDPLEWPEALRVQQIPNF